MCEITGLDQAACSVSDGGIVRSFGTAAGNITDITFDANNQITAMTMSTTGLWAEYVFDTDTDLPYYNQTGERVGNKHTYNQEAYIPFSGLNNTKRNELEELVGCCELVFVHFLSSGLALVQGIEYNPTTDVWRTTKKRAKVTGNFDSQTGADDDLMGIRILSQSRRLSNFTTLTETALRAL